ncbi:MAG: hypothetical protein V8T10_04085 [Merdibacter sp.]
MKAVKAGRGIGEISETARLLRNLNDAGCEEANDLKISELQKGGRRQEQFQLLSLHSAWFAP